MAYSTLTTYRTLKRNSQTDMAKFFYDAVDLLNVKSIVNVESINIDNRTAHFDKFVRHILKQCPNVETAKEIDKLLTLLFYQVSNWGKTEKEQKLFIEQWDRSKQDYNSAVIALKDSLLEVCNTITMDDIKDKLINYDGDDARKKYAKHAAESFLGIQLSLDIKGQNLNTYVSKKKPEEKPELYEAFKKRQIDL